MTVKTLNFFNYTSCIGIILILLFSSCQPAVEQKLLIATAANARFAIEAIAHQFEQETGIVSQVISSSSGQHTAQIEAGAPYDVFISADLKFPQKLHRLGLTLAEPGIYAYGTLVLWTLSGSIEPQVTALTSMPGAHIAMPNPKIAPYGRAAKEALDFHGLYDELSSSLVFGESIAQTNMFILSETASIGFTAASIVMAPSMKNKGRWLAVDKNTYAPITQGAVVIKQSSRQEEAKKFYLFLFSPTAKKILLEYGYTFDEKI